jgi:nucleotide-binding universal stress UspA family protein
VTTQPPALVKRVLCSLEAQERVTVALRAAIDVAMQFDATLDVLQVRDTHEGVRQLKYVAFEDQSLRLIRALDSYQQFDQMVQAAGADIRVATHQVDGPTSSAILREAMRANYDLIVLDSSHGWEVLGHPLSDVGELSEAAAFRAVLTVAGSGSPPEFKRILLPTDFTDASGAAVEWAAAFAAHYSSSIHLLHVTSPQLLQVAPHDSANPVSGAADSALRAVEANLRERGLQTTSSSRIHSDAATAILEHYSHGPFDLVVMGTHHFAHHANAARLGTVARLRQNAEMSLLSVRGEELSGAFARGEPTTADAGQAQVTMNSMRASR